MSGSGVLFAIDDETLGRLGEAEADDEILELVSELEERWERACELDDGWAAIAETCRDAAARDARLAALEHAVVGETLLTEGEVVVTVNAEDRTLLVAAALERWGASGFRAAYAARIRGEGEPSGDEDELDWCTERFERMRALHAEAAQAGRAVLFVGASVG